MNKGKARRIAIKIARIMLVFYWLCLVTLWPLAPILVRPVRAAEVTLDYNDISVDGYVFSEEGIVSRNTTGTVCYLGINNSVTYRSFIDWDTTDIPDGSTIDSVSLIINVSTSFSSTVDIKQMDNASTSYTDNNLYSYIASETTVYVDNSTDFQSTGSKTISLGSTAASNIQNQLAANWFSVSFQGIETSGRPAFSSENNTTESDRPQLVVNYTEGGGGGGAPEFTMTGMLLAVLGGLAGYFVLQRQWNMAEERRGSWRR